MKAEKIITATEPIDIKIKGITLLSIEEYKACKDIVPLVNDWWWLRSPGIYGHSAAIVSSVVDGYCVGIDSDGYCVGIDSGAVRPALIYESSDIKIGDRVVLTGHTWTVISDNMMLCDDVIGHTCFRKDYGADTANNYEKSDIKKWLHDWWKERVGE